MFWSSLGDLQSASVLAKHTQYDLTLSSLVGMLICGEVVFSQAAYWLVTFSLVLFLNLCSFQIIGVLVATTLSVH